MRAFADFLKDMTAQSVHVVTALGNEKKRRKARSFKEISTAYLQKAEGAEFSTYAKAAGVDEEHGLVFGWAIISKQDGKDYVDLQGDHIPESSMLDASSDFMQNSRVAKEMHEGGEKGSVVFAFPLTTDIAKAMGVETRTTGLMIAMKPSDPAMLAKFKDGTYTGFSIGGKRIRDKEITQ